MKHLYKGQPAFYNANEAFGSLFDTIMECGDMTELHTKAIYNTGFYILNPADNTIACPWRKWSKKYADREWNWYLSGNPSVEELKKYAPMWDKMHGGDNIVNSNYGYQWNRNDQLKKCIEQLRQNPNTRQAWISIFDGKEKNKYQFDTPCTMSIGFNVRDYAELDMTVIMRSNDLVYGFCNDQYCFSELQKLVAQELILKVGTYYHFAHDLHIYDYHFNLKDTWLKNQA